MRNFCTYFDGRYATLGITMAESLANQLPDCRLYVLCLDPEACELTGKWASSKITVLSVDELEAFYPELKEAKGNRTVVEYIFTLTPALCSYILSRYSVESITYLDADLFFFCSPELLFNEIGNRSTAIIEHRHSAELAERYLPFGKYNVGWLTFGNDEEGRKVAGWWRDRCIEWCYDRIEAGKFADQGYLNEFASISPSVHVIQHLGANVARWNLANYHITKENDSVLIDQNALIFYHFEGLRQIGPAWFDMGLQLYSVDPNSVVVKHIYQPYIAALRETRRRLKGSSSGYVIPKRRTQLPTVAGGFLFPSVRTLLTICRASLKGDAVRG